MQNTSMPITEYLPNASQIAYGCMWLGGEWHGTDVSEQSLKQAQNAIDTCMELGINLFDHADIYTSGKAEKAFGQILKQRPGLRKQLYIQSKCGIRFADDAGPTRYDFSKDWILQSVEGSLARLQTDYLDILMLHRPDPLMQPEEIAEAFEQLLSAGKVRQFGVSNMHYHQMAYLQDHLRMPLVCNQIEMSLAKHDWLEEGILAGNQAGKDVNFSAGTLEHCRRHNIQLQAWGSLCRGIYSGKDIRAEPMRVQTTATAVQRMAADYQVSPEAILIAWLKRHPANIQPIIGTTNSDRIRACQQATKIQLTREHWYQLYVDARGSDMP